MISILSALILLLPGQASTDQQGRLLLHSGKPAVDAALWLTGETKKAEPLPNASIDQRGKSFLPHVLVVTKGTSVSFPNSDTVLHNVFAQFEAKRFDLGLYPKGQSKHQVFDKVGIVSVRCNIHAQMSAYVVVVDTPYFAVTDSQGRFRISGIPPGTYRLHTWHESGIRDEQTVTIKEKGEPLEIRLSQR